jgi:dTDP-3-amino-3,4,6-trideoxy-alpha-D-glucose transaminase
MITTTMKVPFVDLHAQHEALRADIERAVSGLLDRGDFILGAEVERFERDYAAFIGTRHAIGVGTGLDAIALALRGFGIAAGDEVITPANTFIATVLAIIGTGATPVFVDVDPATYAVDPRAVAAAVTTRTRAIVPVHLYGQPVDLDGVMAVADRHHLLVIEDAAQAHGARYKGRRAGSVGHAAAFSFYPSKNLGAIGDGGMITTSDDAAAAKIRLLRNYGQRVKYYHSIPGTNSRLDTLQAAVLRIKLPHLDGWNSARRHHADGYAARLNGAVRTPAAAADVEHVFHLYVIESGERDALQARLKARQIDTGIHYPVPAHLQDACTALGGKAGMFPVTEAAAARILSLPMYAELTDQQIDYVAEAVRDAGARS